VHRLFCSWRIFVAAATIVLALPAVSAHAEDPAPVEDLAPHAGDFYTRVGLAGVLFETGSKISLAGQRLGDAGLSVDDNITGAGELGYFVQPDLSISLTFGIPPKTDLNGTGILSPLGRLGSVRYGITVAALDYHFNGFGRFQPYFGAGPALLTVFSTQDASLQHLNVDGHWGAAVQVGADYMIGKRWGLYSSVSQLFLQTNGSATSSGLPINAKVTLNPLVVQSGIMFRF